ncbi:hypothetical protein M758_6G122900 [Ceratodon purpureus]|nr:hypothetical protein M758_6G122900 [Ceratodon purpureus]
MAMAGLLTLQPVWSPSPAAANSSRLNSNFFRGARISTSRPAAQNQGTAGVHHRINVTAALPDALLFDCDGVLVDTERDGHRVCFNKAFAEKGLGVHWSVDYFGTILDIGIGKHRITNYFNAIGWPPTIPASQREDVVSALHKRKTDLFIELVESGNLPLRPGVESLIDEALANNVRVAVCSTSLERAVTAIVHTMLGSNRASAMKIFAGDIVPNKKPDPAIYNLAAATLNVRPDRCVVIEDSRIGLRAAKGAGMKCIVTTSAYSEGEDFAIADAVFPCIGERPHQHFDLAFAGSLLRERDLVA